MNSDFRLERPSRVAPLRRAVQPECVSARVLRSRQTADEATLGDHLKGLRRLPREKWIAVPVI